MDLSDLDPVTAADDEFNLDVRLVEVADRVWPMSARCPWLYPSR
jgi:hypothetical protein